MAVLAEYIICVMDSGDGSATSERYSATNRTLRTAERIKIRLVFNRIN